MAAKRKDDGYWGGYPSYLIKEKDVEGGQRTQSPQVIEEDNPFANYPGEFGDPLSAYWNSQNSACGMKKADPVDPVASNQPFNAGQQQTSYYYQQTAIKGKNRIIAGLLALFLGCFGIHKFYLGYNSAGIIMLAVTVMGSLVSLGLAGMVMSVISIIEGIIYLVMGQASFDRTYVYNKKEWF